MAYDVQAGSATIDGTGAKVLTVSDFAGDTPKLVIIKSTKSTSDGTYQDDAVFSFGWGDTNQEDSAQLTSADNVGTSEVGRSIQSNLLTLFSPTGGKGITSTAANPTVVTATSHGYSNGDTVHITKSDSSPTMDGEHTISNVTTHTFTVPVDTSAGSGATTGTVIKITDRISLTSFTADTVTLSVDIWDGTDYTIEYLVLGGSTLTNVKVGSFNAPTSSGNFDVTGVGFDNADAVMMFTSQNDNWADAPPSIHANTDREAAFSFGFFDVDNGSQCAESRLYADDNVSTMDSFSTIGLNTRCWAHYSQKSGAWAVRGQFTFVSVVADGFTLNQQTGVSIPAVAYRINYVALKGGNYESVQKTAPTSAGTQDIVNTGAFIPSGTIFPFSRSSAGPAAMSMGWASNKDGTKANTKEGVAFVSDADVGATSDTKRLTKTDKCLLHDSSASTSAENEADLHTWNSDGVTVDFTTASQAYVYHAIMFGDGTVTPATTFVPRVMMF